MKTHFGFGSFVGKRAGFVSTSSPQKPKTTKTNHNKSLRAQRLIICNECPCSLFSKAIKWQTTC